MENSKLSRKVIRKQNRCKKTLLRHENLETVDYPTKILFIGNGGLVCGIQRETILDLFSQYGRVIDVVMLPDKPYSFVVYQDEDSSQIAMDKLNGQTMNNQDTILYLCYVKDVPEKYFGIKSPPKGLSVIKEFITEAEEIQLLDSVNFVNNGKTHMKHRQVKHFGYEFNYNTNNVDKSSPLEEKIPESCNVILRRLMALGHISYMPNQLTVNQYIPGQGIPPHVDTHSAFKEELISISLGSQVVMDFYPVEGDCIPIVLPQQSVLIMKGESRYLWKHGITPRKTDVLPVFGKDGCHLTLGYRNTRTSFTFRTIRESSCDCEFPKQCDSQATSSSEPPKCDIVSNIEAIHLEKEYVAQVYDEIADHFSCTRYKPWPLVAKFINDIPMGSIVVDAGCGNGKNMNVNGQHYQIGCDVSPNLASICAKRNLNVVVGDVLNLPFRSECADVCICIAVIHHLATESRRTDALRELCRILRRGGKTLVYVWAYEQETSSGSSNYLKYSKTAKKLQEPSNNQQNTVGPYNISVAENRTKFEHQDVYVPWHKKSASENNDGSVHHRYYHVFKQNELESLIDPDIANVLSSYHDNGNWCVIFEKK